MATKKDYSQLKITHEFACGTKMSNEQFMEQRITVEEENNQEIFEDVMYIVSPEYAKLRRIRRENAEYRKRQSRAFERIIEEEVKKRTQKAKK